MDDDEDIAIPMELYGVASAWSEKGAKQHNEDSWCLFCSEKKELIMAAVFDGHGGINGKVASIICRKIAHAYFTKNWKDALKWDDAKWKKEMKGLFKEMHTEIRSKFVELETEVRRKDSASEDNIVDDKGVVRKASGYPMHGGTTASLIAVVDLPERRQVICVNVGDSDVILCPLDEKVLPLTKQNYQHLSVDHGPDSPSEFMRIKKLDDKEHPHKLLFVYDKSNVYRKYECPKVFLKDGTKDPEYVMNPWTNDLRPTNVRYDPAVYAVSPPGVREDVTCIAMTRSLGDLYAHQFGLTWEPDVNIRKLDKNHAYLICVASDGIWDCWKFENLSEFATSSYKTKSDVLNSCKHVVQSTVDRAKSLFGAKSFDDATACFAIIQKSTSE